MRCSCSKKHRSEGNRNEMEVQRPRTRNRESAAQENRSDPCGCWCAWYSEEGYGGKHQESITSSYSDRDLKDLLAGICAKPQKSA